MSASRANFISIGKTRLAVSALGALLWLSAGAIVQDTHPSQNGSTGGTSQNQPASKNDKTQSTANSGTVKIHITVTDPHDQPVSNASVYVRYNEQGSFLHHDKLAELNFKTNQEGSVKVPEVPQGKVLIQVIAKDWHTFGKWYDMDKDEETVSIKLEPPTKWY
ncbi:MAG: carboxypeptidase-like regulatory domain-containing protein [Candidatus Acidiferrales bacterium]